jgi:hypothetical protein
MPFYLSPIGNDQQLDITGAPLVGGKLYTYVGGSSTPAGTYTDILGSALQANPIILNSFGIPASPIWLLGGQTIKFVITDAADVTQRIIDYVSGVNDVTTTTTQSEWVASGTTPTYISATSFSLAGDQRGAFQVGRRLLTTNTAGSIYSTILTSTFATGVTTITVANDSGTLDSGLSAVFYGLISAVNTSLPAISTSGAVTFGGPNITLQPASGPATWSVRTTAGNAGSYVFGTGASDRWRIVKNADAESGSNAGSNFEINRYNDAGSLLGTVIGINRATGSITVTGSGATQLTVAPSASNTGVLAVNAPSSGFGALFNMNTGSSSRWQLGKNNTAESGANAGSDFNLNRYSDAGSLIDAPISIPRATGVVALAQGANITGGNLSVSGASSTIGYATGTGSTVTQLTSKSTGVELNEVNGTITTAASSLAPSAEVGFIVTNSFAAVGDAVIVHRQSGGTDNAYFTFCDGVSAGSFRVLLTNRTGGSLSEAIVLKFMILKGANS